MPEEPRSVREYFLPSEGISEKAIKEHITRYWGSAAKVTAASLEVRRKDVFLHRGGEADMS